MTFDTALKLTNTILDTSYSEVAWCTSIAVSPTKPNNLGTVVSITVGTSDLPSAGKICEIFNTHAIDFVHIYDVDVTGIHR